MAPEMFLLAKLEPSISLSTDQARKVAIQPKFLTAACMVFDIFARLDQTDTKTIAAKIRPHRLSIMSNDVISQLGQIPDLIEEVAPGTVVTDKETIEYRLPAVGLRSRSQYRRDIASISKDQACRDVEGNGDPSTFSRRPPTTLKMRVSERPIREPSDSRLGTSPIPSAPDSPTATIPPGTAHSSLVPSCSGPSGKGASPDRRQPDKDSVEPTSSANDQLPATARQIDTSLKDHSSPYAQALSHMTSLFGTTLSLAKLIIVIRTGDRLVRDDVATFLTDQLPLWRGMWHKSKPLMPSKNDSIADHFVKVSQCIAIIDERLTLDSIRTLLHRVLQYQFYLRFLEEVKQKPKDPEVKRKRGIRNAAYALNHLLEKLYIDDWELVGPAEKQRRRNLLHKQKHLGKRLMSLSSCMGFGILLLGSLEAMGRINNTEFTDDMFNALVCYVFNRYPEIPKLCKMLDEVVRQMVISQTIDEMRVHIENIVPSIETFLECRDDLIPPSQFTRVDLSMYQANPLELFPTRLYNWTDLIQYPQAESIENECASGLAHKRRRISL